jgi:hypothetical protein
MTSRWWTAAALLLGLAVAACNTDDGTAGQERVRPDTLFHPGMDVPGAAGSVTPEVDRRPEPRTPADTSTEPQDTDR